MYYSLSTMTNITTVYTIHKTGYVRSNFKLHCFVCNNTIHRGEDIAQCEEYGGHYSMTLRTRVQKDKSFYTPDTGARWVHKNCQPPRGFTTYTGLLYAENENTIITDKIDYICLNLNIDTPSYMDYLNDFIDKSYDILGISRDHSYFLTIGDCINMIINYIDNITNHCFCKGYGR